MNWALLADGRIVEWAGMAPLGDPAATGDPQGGVVVGHGGPRGSLTEFAGNSVEIHQLAANLVAKGSRLGRGDPIKFEQHFKDHRDLLMRASGIQYPVTPAGQTALPILAVTLRPGVWFPSGPPRWEKGSRLCTCFGALSAGLN